MPLATFFLSTGRCGTQWLAEKLGATYGDMAWVEHEPLHNGYRPRRMLGLRSPLDLGPEASRTVVDHLDEIERRLETRDYIECGHPCWSTLPYLAQRFAGRIRIVHLTRHPVPTALSWLTHSAYVPPLLPHLSEKVLLSPHDEGTAFPEYRARWASMPPYEKALYYWTEVHSFGLEFESAAAAPWLRVRFEGMFGEAGIRALLGFLGLPERKAILEAGLEVVDRHHFLAPIDLPDPGAAAGQPGLMEVAARLGYELTAVDRRELGRRYAPLGMGTP